MGRIICTCDWPGAGQRLCPKHGDEADGRDYEREDYYDLASDAECEGAARDMVYGSED